VEGRLPLLVFKLGNPAILFLSCNFGVCSRVVQALEVKAHGTCAWYRRVWFGACGLARVVWRVWFGACGLARVVWRVWFGACRTRTDHSEGVGYAANAAGVAIGVAILS